MKKIFIITLCVLSFLTSQYSYAENNTYSNKLIYNEAIDALSINNIIFLSEDFNIESVLHRAEGACFIARVIDGACDYTETEPVFTDVNAEHWAAAYINRLYNLGIINGMDDSLFLPNNDMTYEQFIKMIVCYMGLSCESDKKGGYPNGYISVAEENGILEDISFIPSDNIKACDAFLILYRAMIFKQYNFT